MSKALYRKYRSKKLADVIGQKHITDILSKAISSGRISHAYLLTGPRGVGKTSVARIIAHEINKVAYDDSSNNLDIIEIDAASNNGVEDIRDLREKVQIAPIAAEKKIYIIDEVHMLSKQAFNALLKTLEEPPAHVVFILATTNIEKIPATILSRTQRFTFRPINMENIVAHLRFISDQENIHIDDKALWLIAKRGDGSFRDSISLLDQISNIIDHDNDSQITEAMIESSLGLSSIETIAKLIDAVESHNFNDLKQLLEDLFDQGVDINVLVAQITNYLSEIITEKPNLLPLLDQLIDVANSPLPKLKLLSVLGMATLTKNHSKTVALSVPTPTVSASIEDLVEPKPKIKPKTEKQSQKPSKTDELKDTKKITKPKSTSRKNASIDFDWDKLIDYTKQNHVALYSVLSKCKHEIDDNKLTVYALNKFYKKKLDDPKYNALINECLQEIGSSELDIETIPNNPPPKSSQAATIVDIMGGGEEIQVDF